MTIWWLVVILGFLAACSVGFIWIIVFLHRLPGGGDHAGGVGVSGSYTNLAEEETSHLFNKEFREELRNRGRLHFEKIISENAMFLKQDLELTTAQLNQYMKDQISTKLDGQFDAYAKSLQDLQDLARQSLEESSGAVEKQRTEFAKTLEQEMADRKAAMLKAFTDNMAEVVEHYVSRALSEEFDLKAQVPYIVKQMEANKQDIIKDMQL